MRHPEPWDVVDPRRTLTEVLRRASAEPDDVLVAMLRASGGGAHELIDVTRVHTGPNPDRHEASQMLRRHAQTLAGDSAGTSSGWRVPQYLFVTVVCRRGRVVPTTRDYFWLAAWRYSNHLSGGFDGDVYLVTEHGWTGCMDRRAGFEPSLRADFAHLALVPSK
jgi:hypothetical protein